MGRIAGKKKHELGQDAANSVIRSSVPAQYSSLVWSEEFAGTSLDKNTWETRTYYYDSQKDCYCGEDSKLLNVKNGCLTMASQTWEGDGITHACPPSLATNISMNYRYGYLEMLAKVPYKQSAWPALWMGQSMDKYGTEIEAAGYRIEVDIFEIFGPTTVEEVEVVPNIHKYYTTAGQTKYGASSHTMISGNQKETYKDFADKTNLSNQWHVYGFEWTDTYMAMYVDGVEYNRFSFDYNFDGKSDMSGFQNPCYLLLSNAVYTARKDDLNGHATAIDSDFPCEFVIDYIRLYQNPNQENNLCNLS